MNLEKMELNFRWEQDCVSTRCFQQDSNPGQKGNLQKTAEDQTEEV